MKKLTIIDIAKIAGVGKSTVSRVINNDLNVKEKTREKVIKIMEEYNYTPSTSAQNMRLKQNRVIGIINTRFESKSETKAIKGMLEVIYKENYQAIVLESHFSEKKTKEHIELLKNKNISGIIIFAISTFNYEFLKDLDIPVVMVAKKVEGFNSYGYNDYKAIESILNYLEKKKKDKIAYIGVNVKDITTGYQRYLAYQDFTAKKEIPNLSYFGDFSFESGYNLCKNIFEEDLKNINYKLEGIVCGTDNIALGVRKYLDENNLKGILTTGVGDDPLLRFLYPNHISINFQYEKCGEYSAKGLFKLIRDKSFKEDRLIDGKLVYE